MGELQPGEERGTLVESSVPSGTIYSLMPKISRAIGAVAKDRKVQFGGTNFAFRGIEDLVNACHKPFSEHGVFCLPEVLESEVTTRQTQRNGDQYCTMVLVKVTFYAADGTMVSATVKGEACDSADKSTNKAQSSALKTLLIWAFMIPTEDDSNTGGYDDRPQESRQSYDRPRQQEPRGEDRGQSSQPNGGQQSETQQAPKPEMTKEQVAFNELVMPAIKEGRITRDKVSELLKNVAGDYLSATSLVKGHLDLTKNNPPHTGDAL